MTPGDGKTTIDLIRHGEPEGGTCFRGSQDDSLSEKGWSQMRAAVAGNSAWELLITSPLLRCAAFAQELGERLERPVITDPRLQELGFGQWGGRRADELYREVPQALDDFWSDPVNNTPPEGEPLVQFQHRIASAWEDIRARHQGRHLLIVAHGGVNRMIIGQVLGMPLSHLFRMELPYAGISRLVIEQGVPRLVFHCGDPATEIDE